MRDPFHKFGSLLAGQPYVTRWQPAADVYGTIDGWLIKVELAGVRENEFEIRVTDSQLVLRGRRRDWQIREAGECQSMEITYDKFERQFDFLFGLSTASIESEYVDGMLIVRIQHGRHQP